MPSQARVLIFLNTEITAPHIVCPWCVPGVLQAKSGLRGGQSAASCHGWEKSSVLLVWGWKELCAVSSLDPWGSASVEEQALLHSWVTGGLNRLLQQSFTEHRTHGQGQWTGDRARVGSLKAFIQVPFFADAHGLPFSSPFACADLLMSPSAQPAKLFVLSALKPVRGLINLVCELPGED